MARQLTHPPQAILFDLDGTLLDSAPDLLGALNRVLGDEGRPPLALAAVRHLASRGARGMLEAAYGEALPGVELASRIEAFIAHYARQPYTESRPFPGITAMLAEVERRALRWGIVTNKNSRLSALVTAASGWLQRAGCVVSGDTAGAPKPSPLPVLHACRMLGVEPAAVWLLGDDPRDVAAAQAAGCRALLAEWGYLDPEDHETRRRADGCLAHPDDLLALLDGGDRAGDPAR